MAKGGTTRPAGTKVRRQITARVTIAQRALLRAWAQSLGTDESDVLRGLIDAEKARRDKVAQAMIEANHLVELWNTKAAQL